MKRKALAIVLTLVMLVGVLPMGAFAASYTDTEGHWAEKSIDRWTEAKVLEGMGDNLYAPDDNLTRAQAMTIFSRLLNLTEKGDISKLEDVAADAWYAPYIETGYAYQIIKGTSDTTFDPEGSITREQFFSIFARATGIPGTDKLDEGKTFTDLDQISSWFVEEGTVYSMINRGYLNGYPDGSLQPQGNITRAEVAKVLDNAISDYITEDGTYEISGDGIVVVLAKNVKLTGNFNGHIVSSCPDSTLDLSGLTGTPYIYVLGDNTKIINAKPGTKVAVNPAADNVTVNGVKVAYDPYVPVSPYIVPTSGGSGGSGGGGGGYTPAPTPYAVNVTVQAKNAAGSRYGFDVEKAYTVDAAKASTLKSVVNDLFKGNNGKDIAKAYGEIYARFIPAKTQSWYDGEYTLTLNPDGTFKLERFGLDKTAKYIGDWDSRFEANAKKAAEDAGVPAPAMADVEAFIQAANPTNLIDGNQILGQDKFLSEYWGPAVDAGVKMLDTLQANGFTNYNTFFENVFNADAKCTVDNLAIVDADQAGFVSDRNYDSAGNFIFVTFTGKYSSASDLLAATKTVAPVSGDLADKDAVKAFAKIIDDQKILDMSGLEISLEITATHAS